MTVAIIGGGASGTLTAVHLLRAASPVRVVMVERSDRTARGVAYSTRFPHHLLNVLPASMSGLAEDPDHLLRWLDGEAVWMPTGWCSHSAIFRRAACPWTAPRWAAVSP